MRWTQLFDNPIVDPEPILDGSWGPGADAHADTHTDTQADTHTGDASRPGEADLDSARRAPDAEALALLFGDR